MGIAKMKVYEVGVKLVVRDDEDEEVIWIRTDREITMVEGSDMITYCKEIDISIDAAGIDLNIE